MMKRSCKWLVGRGRDWKKLEVKLGESRIVLRLALGLYLFYRGVGFSRLGIVLLC